MFDSHPLVSVLLPALRNDNYLRDAINSILNQTFRDFHILLIADKNWDLNDLMVHDSRIRHLKVSPDINLSQKLNIGIDYSDSKYLARMDADDIAHENRLQIQVTFLELNSNIDIVGTGIRFIGELPNHRHAEDEIALLPSENDQLLTHMLYKNPFFHPTVMIRSEKLNHYKLRYNERFVRSQDLELWSRAAGKLVFANIREPLLSYRLHESQIGVMERKDSEYFSSLAMLRYCIISILIFDQRSRIAIKMLPFRLKRYLSTWVNRRGKN